MLQGGGARLRTMIHLAPLPMEFLVRMAPLPSAGKWLPNFAVFRKFVLLLHTLFSTIEDAGHILVILDVFMESLFTYEQLSYSLSLVSIFRLGHVFANSYIVHCPLFVFATLVTGLSAGLVVAFQKFHERPLVSVRSPLQQRKIVTGPVLAAFIWPLEANNDG